jgi:hypothetical protein
MESLNTIKHCTVNNQSFKCVLEAQGLHVISSAAGSLTVHNFIFELLEHLDPLAMGDELLAHSLNKAAILNGIASNLFASPSISKK